MLCVGGRVGELKGNPGSKMRPSIKGSALRIAYDVYMQTEAPSMSASTTAAHRDEVVEAAWPKPS